MNKVKKYKAIFFDWDGTAVLSRKAPADEAVAAMKPLLLAGTKLVIVSGTTIENIIQGDIERAFTKDELQNLYLGLGRGAYNYAFDEAGRAYVFQDRIPDRETILKIHQLCFDLHCRLLAQYGYETDLVFSRPNYCKIDLMVQASRGTNLFMQAGELELLKAELQAHGIEEGVQGLIRLAQEMGKQHGLFVVPTCDAKYLEVGISSKSDNVNTILDRLHREAGVEASDCAFWGDEYVGIEPGIFGSDSFMLTEKTKEGDFFDVSEVPGLRPQGVVQVGGKVERFLEFLRQQKQ